MKMASKSMWPALLCFLQHYLSQTTLLLPLWSPVHALHSLPFPQIGKLCILFKCYLYLLIVYVYVFVYVCVCLCVCISMWVSVCLCSLHI